MKSKSYLYFKKKKQITNSLEIQNNVDNIVTQQFPISQEILSNNFEDKEDKEDKEDLKEDIKLIEIKKIADNIYKENITNNIINYIKKNNNDNISYGHWLKLFSKSDWVNEFDEKGIHRENKIYHDIWDDITYEENGFILLY